MDFENCLYTGSNYKVSFAIAESLDIYTRGFETKNDEFGISFEDDEDDLWRTSKGKTGMNLSFQKTRILRDQNEFSPLKTEDAMNSKQLFEQLKNEDFNRKIHDHILASEGSKEFYDQEFCPCLSTTSSMHEYSDGYNFTLQQQNLQPLVWQPLEESEDEDIFEIPTEELISPNPQDRPLSPTKSVRKPSKNDSKLKSDLGWKSFLRYFRKAIQTKFNDAGHISRGKKDCDEKQHEKKITRFCDEILQMTEIDKSIVHTMEIFITPVKGNVQDAKRKNLEILEHLGQERAQLYSQVFQTPTKARVDNFLKDQNIRKVWPILIQMMNEDKKENKHLQNLPMQFKKTYHKITTLMKNTYNLDVPKQWEQLFPAL